MPVRATSGTDGRFAFTFDRADLDNSAPETTWSQVVAGAKGYGFDVVSTSADGKDGERTLHLVKDVPITGRILDPEGRPVAGARVRLADVRAYKGEDLADELADFLKGGLGTHPAKSWSGPLPGQAATVTTGTDGRFRLTGLGRERRVRLHVEGPAIQYGDIEVMTRAAEAVDSPNPHRKVRLYGAAFDHLAAASRPIRGVVREQATGKPVAGVQIGGIATSHKTQTDGEGRYELLGYPKSQEYHLTALPADGQPYFKSNTTVADTPGIGPLAADVQMVRGIPLRGRVTDKATGKPIRSARVEYFAVFPNANTRDGSRNAAATSGPDGSFALVVLPGPGLLAVATYSPDFAYIPALVTPAEMKAFYKDWAGVDGNSDTMILVAAGGRAAQGLVQENYNALVLIEPDVNADKLTRDVALQPARTRKGSVSGPDGKPLAGVTVFGLGPNLFGYQTLKGADFTVAGLNPKRSRQLLFVHKDRGLGFYQEIAGAEAGPLAIKLQPLGSASGRVLDRDGQPIPGLALDLNRSRLLGPGGTQVKTDRDGRFRAEGLVPGQKYDLVPANRPRPARLSTGIVVEPGKDTALGDLTADVGN